MSRYPRGRVAAPIPIQVTSNSAVIAAPARVEYGAGRPVLWSGAARGGRVQLRGLLPGTRYVVRVRGVSRSFRTPPPSTLTTRVGAHGAILLNGSPFLPVMQWLQCPALFAPNVALGVNVFLGRGCDGETDAEEVAAVRAAGAYSVLPYDASVASAPSLFGWRFDDEPDQKRTPPEKLTRPRDARHVTFLTLTSRFVDGDPSLYRRYVARADVVGFDLYPVTGYCRPDWLPRVYDQQRRLVELADGKPTYQWIEAISTASQFCTGRGVAAAELRAEAWLSIVGGAKAIGYFTHSWKPTYSQFRVSPDVQAAMRRTNAELAAYAPAILAAPLDVSANVRAIARRFHGATYVFAVNEKREGVEARVQVASRTLTRTLPPLGVWLQRLYI
jgi:hypothetical protein